jgi:GcrA cell cycle regulator
MGLGDTERSKASSLLNEAQLLRLCKRLTADDFSPVEFFRHPPPKLKPEQPVRLRCVEVDPRYLTLVELESGDCRYPYGGDRDGDSITFCGHPRRRGSSYCTPHFRLTRNPDVATAPVVRTAALQAGAHDLKLPK